MQIESIILDVDGTLWDTTEIVASSWNRAIRTEGIRDVTVTAEQLKKLFGKTMTAIAEAILDGYPENIREQVMDRCCRYEHEDLENDPCEVLYPDVKETIRKLSEKCRLFIVSNCQSGYIELFLAKTGLSPFITDIECFGNTGKQKGENIRLLMERNGVTDAVYVGDIRGDYEAARKAGIPFVFAAYGFGEVPESEWKIKKFAELLDLQETS